MKAQSIYNIKTNIHINNKIDYIQWYFTNNGFINICFFFFIVHCLYVINVQMINKIRAVQYKI